MLWLLLVQVHVLWYHQCYQNLCYDMWWPCTDDRTLRSEYQLTRFDIAQVPRFETNKLLVEEGGILSLSIAQLSASDADTLSSELVFVVDALPRFGSLQKEGRTLRKGAKFILDDLRKKHIRYESPRQRQWLLLYIYIYMRREKYAVVIPANKIIANCQIYFVENQALKNSSIPLSAVASTT